MDSQGSREIGRKVELGREGGSGRVRGKNLSREGRQRVSGRKVGREPEPSFSPVFSMFPWPGGPGESKNIAFSLVFGFFRFGIENIDFSLVFMCFLRFCGGEGEGLESKILIFHLFFFVFNVLWEGEVGK